MSGTDASLITRSGFNLPVPHVVLVKPLDQALNPALNPNTSPLTRTLDGTEFEMLRMPLVTAVGLQDAAFEADLRVELLWFRKERRRSKGGGANGYRHPAHGLSGNDLIDSPTGDLGYAQPLPISRFNGGRHNTSPSVGTRVSEWSLTGHGDQVLIDTLGQYFVYANVDYMDNTGNGAAINLPVPTFRAAMGRAADKAGFGYASSFRANYFAFRFSVADPTDNRARVYGPISRVVKCTTPVHPFVQNDAATALHGVTCVDIDTGLNTEALQCWFETRIPG